MEDVVFFGEAMDHRTCTCPYDGSGDCKHVVAVFLGSNSTPTRLCSRRSTFPGILWELLNSSAANLELLRFHLTQSVAWEIVLTKSLAYTTVVTTGLSQF